MSHPVAYYDYWQDMWDKHAQDYFDWCNERNMQADLSEFSIWCEDMGLIMEDEVYA